MMVLANLYLMDVKMVIHFFYFSNENCYLFRTMKTGVEIEMDTSTDTNDNYNDTGGWLITASSIQSTNGLAFCRENNLRDCTYNKWYVREDVEDYSQYNIEASMGYENVCDQDPSDDDNTHIVSVFDSDSCEDYEFDCAWWQLSIDIEMEDYSNDHDNSVDLCDNLYIVCVTESLYSSYSSDVEIDHQCRSNYHVTIDGNVPFDSVDGNQVYYSFIESYSQIINQCVENENIDSVVGDIRKFKLHLCSDCSDFVSQESMAYRCTFQQFIFTVGMCLIIFLNL